MGVSLIHLGNYSGAMKYIDKALQIDPNFIYALNTKGLVLYNLGRYGEAISYYDKALAIDPNLVEALKNKANVLTKLTEEHGLK
jgi:tetratricopeptide (TPR) repeat protein